MNAASPPLTARALEARDIERAGHVLVTAFNQVFQEHGFVSPFPSLESGRQLVATYLSQAETFGTVVEDDRGQLTAIAFAHVRGKTAGIGPVAVAPHVQGRRVGRVLMEALMAGAPGVDSFRLTQDAFNNVSFSLYARLGFVVRDVALALERAPASPPSTPAEGIRRITSADIAAAIELDAQLTGVRRPVDFVTLMEAGDGLLLEEHGRLTGYLLRRIYVGHMMIGPAAAATDADLYRLIAGALAANPTFSAGLRFLASRPDLLNRLFADGFRVAHLGTFMVRGPWAAPTGATIPAAFPESL